MFWWRHAGGLTSESPTGGCPPKGDSLSSRVPPHLPTDVEEGQSAACGSRILGNVRERRKGGLDAFHGAHRRVAGWEPPGASVRRCLTSSPTRGRSRLQTRSSSLYSSDLRKFCQKGIDIVNRTGSRSPTSGSDWLSLRSEEYFSACSDSLNSPTASDGKEMSFATRTASSQSDAGNSIEPLHRRSLSNRSCLHTTSTRVVWGRADRLRSAPDGRAGASFRTALVPARSFSLPLLGPPVLKATPSGAPSASFRCISSSPFDFGEGEEESKPLHEQVKALAAPAFLDTHRGATNSRPTPYPLHEASQRISREEVSRLGEYRKPGVHIGSFPHYGLCVAPETGDADERGGSWSPSEFEAFPEGLGRLSLIANLATSDGPAETRDLPSLRLFSNGCYRKATEANRVGELQAGKRTSGGIRRSASFRTPATDVFGSTRCDRRSRSWTALNTRSSSYRLLPAFNSSEQLPFLLANAASSVRRNSQTAIGGSSDCRTYKEDSKSFASIGELPANGAGDVDGRRRFEATREEEVGSKQEKAEALRIAEAELETRSVRQGGIHDADTLQLLERGSCGAGTGPCADGLQASSLSHPDVHMESSNTVAECVGAFASALSNGDASGVSAAVAVASQQQNADLARETVSGTNHAGKELQAPAVVRHTECGEVPRGGLTTQQPLQRPFVDMAALFPIGLLPKQRQRDAVIACNHPLGDQKEHKAHGSPPLQATRFSCAVGLSTEEANAPTSEVLFGSAGRGSCGDAQENQARQRMLASADEPAASIDSSLSPGLDTAQVNISFHDAWPVAIGEAEEPKRRTSRASEGGMNCRNRQEPQTRQWSLPASVEGAAPLHWSNLGFLQEATAPDDRFQDAVNGSPGKAEEPQRELSRASEGGKGRGNPQKPQTRQWSLPASAGGAVSLPCSSLGLLEEAGTADESLQDMMKGAVGEAEVRDREVLRGSEGGNVGEDTQNLQTRQESLAALLAGAGPLPCSSLGFSREIGEADESFHNASGVAVGEAEEPKREASRASEGGRRRRNTQEPQTRQRSLPVSVKKAVSPTWSSLGFAREATAQSDGFHDAIDGFVGEAGEPKRWASHGNESGSGCGSPQTVRTRQGSLLASVEGAGAIPYSSLGFLQEAATPDEGFQDAINGSPGEAEEPQRGLSRASEGGKGRGNLQKPQTRQWSLPASVVGAVSLPCSSLGLSEKAEVADESLQDAKNGAVGEAEVRDHEALRGRRHRSGGLDTQEPQPKQGTFLAIAERTVSLPCSSLGFPRETGLADASFEDAIGGVFVEDREREHEAFRSSEGGNVDGDTQKPQKRQGSLPTLLAGAGLLPCSRMGLAGEAWAADEGFQDAINGAVGEAEERDREALRSSEGGDVGKDAQDLQERQESLPAVLAGAGSLPCSSLGLAGEAWVADEGFQDAINGAVGEAEERDHEMLRGSEGGNVGGDTQNLQTRQGSPPALSAWAGSLPRSCLSFSGETGAADASFHSASGVAVGEDEAPKREASHASEGGRRRRNTQEPQKRQGSLPASDARAVGLPWTSLGFSREAEEADASFQDAINGAVGEAEERDREALRSSEGGDVGKDAQDLQERQESLPAVLAGAGSLPCSSLGLAGEAWVADEGFQDAINGAVGEAEERDHEMLRGSEGGNVGGDTQNLQTRQGSPPALSAWAGSLPRSCLSFSGETGAADASFHSASGVAVGEDEAPKREASHASEGGRRRRNTQEPQKRQGSLPASDARAVGLPWTSLGFSREAEEADASFQDAINGAVGEAEERDREALRSSEGGDVGKDAQDLQERQESLPAVLAGAGSLPCSSLGLAGEAWVADEGFQDAINGAVGEAEERDHEMLRGSEGGNVGGDTQNLQTRQGFPPALSAWAGSLPRSCLSFSGETGAADASFHSASGVAVGEDEAPKREASHASEGGRRRRNTQEPQKRQGSLPANDARAVELPWTSLGFSREAEEADASFQDAINGAVGEAEERDREALRSSEGGDVGKDAQDLQERQESLPAVLAGAGSLPCSSLGLAGEAWVADEGFQDAINGAVGEAEERDHEMLRGSEGGNVGGDTQNLQTRQGFPPALSAWAGSLPRSCLSFSGETGAADASFHSASGVAVGEDEAPKREASHASEGGRRRRNTQEPQKRQGSLPANDARAVELPWTSLGFSREAEEADASFQDAINGAVGEAEERDREALRSSEGGDVGKDAQDLQERQESLPAVLAGAGSLPCSSLGLAGEAWVADEGFQDALNGSGGEAEELKREALRGSQGGRLSGELQELGARRGPQPVSVGAVPSLWGILGFAEDSVEAGESFQDAVNEAGGEAEEPKHEASLGIEKRCLYGERPEVGARQRTPPVGAYGAGVSSCSPVSFSGEDGEADESFHNSSGVTGGEAEEPKRRTSRASEGGVNCRNRQEPQTRQWSLPANVYGPCASSCSSLAFAGKAATPDEGFQDAANEASGEAEEPKRELSRASEGGKGRGNPQKSQTRQGSLPVNLVEVALLHRSSSDFSRLVLAPEECFHDAVDVAGGEAEEPKRELPLGSGWRGSSGDTPKVTTRRGAQPVSLEGVVASLWSSLGFAWESGRVEESFQDALNGAGGEEEEPKREGASVRDCRSTSGDRPELRAQPGVLLVGVDEAVSLPCSSLAFAREDTALDESFHDASNGAGGETEEPQHETPRGSERRRSSGDKSEVGARQGAPPLTVYGAGASSSSPVSFSGEDGAADESFHDATGVAVGEAEGPKREASRASEGGRDRGNTQEPQTRQESLTKSGGGACVSSCSSLGFSREAVELDEGIQNVFGLGVGEAEELKLKASFASEGRARCDETGERGERQGTLVKGGGCEQNVEPQDASNAAFGNSESPSGSNGNSSLGELQTGQKTLQNRTEAPTGYPRLRVASFNGGAVSDWCECAPDGCGEDNNSEMEHCGETMLSTGSLYPSVRIFREAHGFGCRDDKTQLLSGAQSTDHEPRKNYAQQQLRQVRCLGEKEPSALQIPPSCPFGSPSRRSETVSSCNCASSHEVCNRRHDDTLNSDRAFSRDTNSCCICKATEQYYIGSRGSSEGSSSSNSSDHEGSCSGSESCSSSYDSSRSSCSSCCSEERSDQSSESAQTNISRDSSVYEKWSSCREFPSRAFGQGGDAEPSLGAASCPLSSPVVSIASRALSQDNTELDEESRTLHELKRTQAQISPRYANYEERPTVLPLHVEGLEGKEAAQRQEVHAGICVSSPVPRIVFASSSQASLSSRQPLGASHWSAPALGLAAALSSLAQLVFTSREPCTSPTRVKGKAPFPQARGVVNDRLTAAAPEERIQEEHLSADAHSRVQGAFGACQEKLTTNDGRLAARGLEEDPSRADVASASNAETGVLRRSLKSRLRGRFIGERLRDVQLDGVKSFLWHFGAGVALRGNSVPETAAAEECLAIREGSEGHHISTDDAKKRSFSTSTSSSRKGIQLSKRQNALTMLHGFGRKDSALWRHSGSLHLPHKAQWMCSSMPAEGEQFTAEPWPLVLPRRGATSSSAFGPTHSNVDRRQIRESFTSKFSEGLAEGGVNSSGPRSSDGNLFKSSMSSAEKVSSFSSDRGDLSKLYAVADGDRSCLVYRTLPLADSRCVLSRNMERPVARKRSISSEDSHYSQTGCGCGLHLVPDGAAKRHLTADPPGRRSFSATHVDFQFDGRTHTRWGSWGTLRTAHGGAAIPHMDFQRMHPGNGYAVQPTSPRQSDSSVPMLARANSIGWGGSEPLDMAATHRILESAVEFALHKQPQGRACQISGDRLRKEKLKMLLGGAGDKEPSKARRPGVPASASADSLVAHHTPIVYKGTMKKRLALHQPALACRMPLNIFCGNFLSASSLWTLQLRRPFASEEGERQLFSRSSSEDFGKEESGRGGLQQNEGYSTQEETFRSASSGETLPTPSVQPAKRLSCSPLNPLVQELLGFSSYEFGSAPDIRRSTVVEHSGCPTAKTSQSQAREESSELNSNTMPKPRRPWACGEPVSVAQDESRSAVRTYIHRPGCRCSLCLPAWGVAGHSGGAPVERHGDTYSSLEIPTPRLQAGLPVVPSPPGGYAAASPMRIFSSPLGPYPGYGPGNGNAIRVESPTRVQYGVGERVTAPPSYFDHQGGKFSIPTVQSVYPVEGLQTPRVQTVSCNQPVRQTQSSHPSASYPLTADENYQKGYSQGRQACVPSDTPTRDPLHSKSPISAVSSRDVSFDESEKLRVQQEQQQKEADELRRRQEELEKEQKKLREELELERQQLKEQRERLEEQRQAFEQEKQELLHAQLLATSKGRSRGLESSSSVGKGSPERLPVNNTEDAFDLPRNTAARTQHGPPIRHTTSTSNIVRSITGSGFGELQSDTRHGGSAVDADGTEEKASNAVAGRPQSLHPTASCARFFSRTASVDTNDEKEPALSLQDDLQTDPSMALSTALDKLAKIRMKLETLQQQLEVQSQEVTSYYSALKAADQVHSSLQQTAADCRVCYGRRHTQMQEVEKRLIVLTAQDLHPCSVDELEELAQELEGTQYKLTVVQAQRAGGSAEESHKKPKQLLPYSSSCLPDPKSSFAIPEEPVARIGPEECAAVQESALQEIKALGDDLEHIKAVHSEYKKAYKRLQGTMTQQINSYDVDLQRLIAIEKNLEEKLRRLLFLNGDANYAELSDAQMQEYFRLVNLSIRKVYREIALRESGDRKRNEPRTSGSLNSRGSHAGSHQHHLDARDNEPNGAHRLGGDAVASSFSPPGHNVERSQAHGHNFQGNLGAARNCCNPVHVPFVAGSRASSIAAQRMLAHDSRLAPRQTSVERASSREKFHHRWLAETESHASKVLDE